MSEQNGHDFSHNIVKCTFVNEKHRTSIQLSLTIGPNVKGKFYLRFGDKQAPCIALAYDDPIKWRR